MKFLFSMCLFVSFCCFALAQKVKVEGVEVAFDASPRMVRGVLMVPVRNLVTAMGGTMRWNLESRVVSVWRSNRRWDMTLDSRQAVVNGKVKNMEEASFMEKGRIFVPLKFMAEAGGYIISSEGGWFVLRLNKP